MATVKLARHILHLGVAAVALSGGTVQAQRTSRVPPRFSLDTSPMFLELYGEFPHKWTSTLATKMSATASSKAQVSVPLRYFKGTDASGPRMRRSARVELSTSPAFTAAATRSKVVQVSPDSTFQLQLHLAPYSVPTFYNEGDKMYYVRLKYGEVVSNTVQLQVIPSIQ